MLIAGHPRACCFMAGWLLCAALGRRRAGVWGSPAAAPSALPGMEPVHPFQTCRAATYAASSMSSSVQHRMPTCGCLISFSTSAGHHGSLFPGQLASAHSQCAGWTYKELTLSVDRNTGPHWKLNKSLPSISIRTARLRVIHTSKEAHRQ